MTCDEFVAGLSEGVLARESAQAHLALCGPCRALAALDSRLRGLGARPVSAKAVAIGAALRDALDDPRPTSQPLSPWQLRVLMFVTVALCVVFEWAWAPRSDLTRGAPAAFWLSCAVLVSLWLGACLVAWHRGASGLGLPAMQRSCGLALCVLGFWAFTSGQAALWGHGVAVPLRSAAPRDCLLQGVLIAGIALAVLWFGQRRTVLQGAALVGALLGCAAGLASAIVLHVHCHAVSAMHLQIAHGSPIAMAIVIGALAGPRSLSPA